MNTKVQTINYAVFRRNSQRDERLDRVKTGSDSGSKWS